MNTTTYLHIANQCHENWYTMTQAEKGRFCAQCNTVVQDFTVMTDQQLLSYLQKHEGKLCGRVHESQLQRALRATHVEAKKGWQLLVASATSLFFFMQKGWAQTKQEQQKLTHELLMPNNSSLANMAATKTIKAVVVNAEQQALLHAYAVQPDQLNKILTNKHGAFVMEVPANTEAVLVGAKGYETRVVPIQLFAQQDTTIVLNKQDTTGKELNGIGKNDLDGPMIMGGITAFKEVDSVANPITSFVKKIFNHAFFKIVPNPTTHAGVSISVKKMGTYTVQLFDNNSKLVHSQVMTISSKGQVVQIPFPSCVTKGVYYIRLLDAITKEAYVDKIIVQS